MKSFQVKVVENKKEIEGTLKLKEDSITVNTNDNFIKIPYDDIKSYNYKEDSKKLTIQAKGLKVTLIIDYDKQLFQKLNEIVEDTKQNSNDNIDNPTSQKNSVDNSTTTGEAIFIILCLIGFIVFIMYVCGAFSGNDDTDNGGCTTYYCRKAEDYALEDIPEMALVWDTVKVNELTCNADVLTDDQIALVKCETTNDEIIKHFESSEIWYGYIEAADGKSYFRYADSDKNVVLAKLRQ